MPETLPVKNTDREIWRRVPGDYYSDSIHVTEDGRIGMNTGGRVVVLDLAEWQRRAAPEWLEELAEKWNARAFMTKGGMESAFLECERDLRAVMNRPAKCPWCGEVDTAMHECAPDSHRVEKGATT